MIFRSRLLITAALVCHLLLAPSLVTSQLLSSAPSAARDPSEPSPTLLANPQDRQQVTLRALEQEKQGNIFTLRGEAQVYFRSFVLRADHMSYDSSTGQATADGHVIFDGGPHDEHLEASHGTYNVRSDQGRFYDVTGTTGVRFSGRNVSLTSSNPFSFTGKVVDKTGPDHYIVSHGTVTTCQLPNPKWSFQARRIVVDVGNEAKIHYGIFRVRGIPVFFMPYATHPVERLPRQSGFLMPTYGTSSVKGTVLGDAYYWAINRSMDATLGAEYYSSRGWAQQAMFRARPTNQAYVGLNYFGVIDRGFGPSKIDQGGQDLRVAADNRFGNGFRGVLSLEYLSSLLFRLAWRQPGIGTALGSEIQSTAFLSRTSNGFSLNALVSRYQNFQTVKANDFISVAHEPTLEASSVERPLAGSRFYWSFDSTLEGLHRTEPGFHTAPLVGRFDLNPDISLPLLLHGWSLRPELSVRETAYSQSLRPSSVIGVTSDRPLARNAYEGTLELRPPAVDRIFRKKVWGRTLKHVVEPRIVYRYVNGVENFPSVIRFDSRDILSDTNEVEYAVVNRLYAKQPVVLAQCLLQEGATVPEVLRGTSTIPTPAATAGTAPTATPGALAPSAPTTAAPATTIPGAAPGEVKQPGTPATALATSDCTPHTPEIVTWELAQKYFIDPNFGGALIDGRRNVFTTTADFTGIAFLTEPRHSSPVTSRLRIQAIGGSDIEWDLDYDTKNHRISSSNALVNLNLLGMTVSVGRTYLKIPGEIAVPTGVSPFSTFNQYRFGGHYGGPSKRGVSAGATVGYDARLSRTQYSAVEGTYNWDCCGLNFEFRRWALGPVRTDNEIRFSFTLANVGAFGTLRRQERLY